MKIEKFVNILNSDFYTGVPDSQLKELCNYLIYKFGNNSNHHIIAANEGSCTAIAAGYHLATGKIPVVYMQNSGEGNAINPIASLLNEKVYAIPVIFVIGWRGEPGVHDEPQHLFQGEITLNLLKTIDIEYFIIDQETKEDELKTTMDKFNELLKLGKSVAFVVKKGSFKNDNKVEYKNNYSLVREEIIKHITNISGDDPIISTTGKTSRELFEIREFNNQEHKYDFLTVGSMGHSSSISLAIALNKVDKKVWCIDGDGAVIMHMGSLATIGSRKPSNLIHVVINNEAHESVGGMPTVANDIDLVSIAKACGYPNAVCVNNLDDLDKELLNAKQKDELFFIEIKCSIGSRDDLGRPTISAIDNKKNFMNYLMTD